MPVVATAGLFARQPARLAVLAAALALGLPVHAVEAGARVPSLSAAGLRASDRAIEFDRLRGSVVYVDFWASWCVPCRTSMPVLDEFAKRFGARGFRVVGINKDASAPEAERFLRRVPVTFALVADPGDALARAFKVQAMPSGYLVDRAGVVRHVHRGFNAQTAAALEREIEALLRE